MSTATQQAAPRTKAYDPLTGEKWRLAKRMSSFYVLLIPPVVLLFIFHYIPIYGAVIAFKDFHYGKGILGSPWNDFLHFERLFQDPFFFRVLRNSILINVLHLVFGFPAPILLALLVNEVAHTAFRKTCQTISYLPHFVSWVVLATIVRQLLHPTFGVAAYAFDILGMEAINFLAYPPTFRGLLVVTAIWQGVGWGAIIYLAALSSIDESLYESFLENGLTGLAEQEVVEGFRHPQRRTISRSESTC